MKQLAHFDLKNEKAYLDWREKKLSYYHSESSPIVKPVEISDYRKLSNAERCKIKQQISGRNFSLYRVRNYADDQSDIPVSMAKQLGLLKSDKHLCGDEIGLSQIKVTKKKGVGEYIPYTNNAINWHTDGYYNDADKKIHSMILHCESDALEGGDNAFIDHEIVYILLRDENPDYITALSDENVLIIPENRQEDVLIRAEQSGPVFSVCPWGLHMRYTARTKSIIWRDDALTERAVARIREIYNDDSIYKTEYRLHPGEGVLSNNILHMRTKFLDDHSAELETKASADARIKKPEKLAKIENTKNPRLMYRMRFYQPLLRS